MVIKEGLSKDIILVLFRNPTTSHTISSLTEELKKSRVGIWKTVKTLEKHGYLRLDNIELLRKKVYIVNLNWDNPLVEKSLGILLLKEALNYEEWTKNFKNIGNVLDFLILCEDDKSHNITGITQKGKFVRIQKPTDLLEKNIKEINTSSITNLEFMKGLKNKKEELIHTIRNGVILFGQENFISFIKAIDLNS